MITDKVSRTHELSHGPQAADQRPLSRGCARSASQVKVAAHHLNDIDTSSPDQHRFTIEHGHLIYLQHP